MSRILDVVRMRVLRASATSGLSRANAAIDSVVGVGTATTPAYMHAQNAQTNSSPGAYTSSTRSPGLVDLAMRPARLSARSSSCP